MQRVAFKEGLQKFLFWTWALNKCCCALSNFIQQLLEHLTGGKVTLTAEDMYLMDCNPV